MMGWRRRVRGLAGLMDKDAQGNGGAFELRMVGETVGMGVGR
ncbi:MAG: hypothetical protein ACOYLQ_12675 [Hyphomicrobiaceae bacterium]